MFLPLSEQGKFSIERMNTYAKDFYHQKKSH